MVREFFIKNKYRIFLIIILNIFVGIISIYPMKIMQKAIDSLTFGDGIKIFVKFVMLYLFLYVLANFMKIFIYNKAKNIEIEFISHIRLNIIKKILNSKVSSLEKIGENVFYQKFIEDLSIIEDRIVDLILMFTFSLSNFVVGTWILLENDIFIGVIIFPLSFITTLIIKFTSKNSEILSLELQDKRSNLNRFLSYGIIGVKDITSFSKENLFLGKFTTLQKKLNYITKKVVKIQNISQILVNLSFNLIIGLLILIGGFRISSGNFTIGGLVAILMYNSMITDPVFSFIDNQKEIFQIYNSLKRIGKSYSMLSDRDFKNLVTLKDITFKDVNLKFNDIEILKDFNFKIDKGDKVRILGRTGVGKSSIIKLITDLYSQDSGEILVNGKIKNKISTSIVFQKNILFDDSIEENIKFWENVEEEKYDKVIDISRVREILNKHNFENIGDNANKLSGGERTRILIARALLKDSDIYIFDEISTGLDEKLFYEMFEDIMCFLKEKTVIVIDHKYIDNKYFDKSILL